MVQVPRNPAVENPALGQIRWGFFGRLMENFPEGEYLHRSLLALGGGRGNTESQASRRAISQRGEGVAWCFSRKGRKLKVWNVENGKR